MNNFNEIYVQQVRKIQNSEVVFVEMEVFMLFANEDLWDPTIMQSTDTSGTPLGSLANYRAKYIVSYSQQNYRNPKIILRMQ